MLVLLSVVAQYERSLVDRFSRECKQPTGALVNQNAASHLRQSGRMSIRHAWLAQMRLLFMQTRVTTEHERHLGTSFRRQYFS